MELVQKMKKALQKGRSVTLPEDPAQAVNVLLPYILQNQIRPVMELLNNSNCDVNYKFGRAQRTLLHSAANTGSYESLLFLLKKGCIVNVIDRIGITPLHLAARNGHKKCVQKLVECGADISIHDNEGLTALHWLACNGRTELLMVILQKGEFVDVVDIHGHTSLHVAAQNGHIKCVEILLDARANLNKVNENGRTPLFLSCRHGQLKCVKILLDRGAEIIPDANGMTLIDISAEGGYKECIEILLSKYPDLIGKLVNLVKQDTIPLPKIQSVLEYLLSKETLALRIIFHLASLTSMAGMELLSVSSSYQDLMPQFLRCIKVLCSLYPLYHKDHPSSPPLTADGQLPSPDRSNSRTRSFLNSWGHRRTGSTDNVLEQSGAVGRRGSEGAEGRGTLGDPLDKLEMVWASLESWFDLILKEFDKISSSDDSSLDTSDSSTSDNSQLAAAIILSAPQKRREVYLKHQVPAHSNGDKRASWRRSWHADRYVKVTPLTEEEGEEPISLPLSYHRSKSTEMTTKDREDDSEFTEGSNISQTDNSPPTQSGATPPTHRGTSPEDQSNPDIVDAYADRLAAVMHAFSLCCKVVNRNSKEELLPRFKAFVEKYDHVLKILLAKNPQMIFAHFHFLLESTELLSRFMHVVRTQSFDERRKWFYENLHGDKPPIQQLTLQSQEHEFVIDRDELFHSSCARVGDAPVQILKESLVVRFEGEAGMGSGVYREWFNNLSAEILNPDYALFTQSSDGATFQPNSHSDVNPDHLSYFKFAGRTMSLALYHQQLLSVYFTRSFYKHILGVSVSYRDVESIDPEYANNLQWLLDNSIDELDLGLTFSLETDVFGAMELIELKPDGSTVSITDENKAEYVQLVTEMRMTQAIGTQIKAFTDGFYEIVPHHLISLFNEYELEFLMSGLPDIDITDWEKNTEYNGYSVDDCVIKWFWEVMAEYDKKDLAVLLQFATGSSRVPLGGFANLVGASGITKFTISRLEYHHNRLPMASTCFNLLKLPEYMSKDMLRERLKFAITCGSHLIDIT